VSEPTHIPLEVNEFPTPGDHTVAEGVGHVAKVGWTTARP